jgi:hypothetical protein
MNNDKTNKILQLIRNNEPQRNHFFKKVATIGNPFPLLKPLYDEGYFKGERNPEPQEVPEQKGCFVIPYWKVLGYLENVAKQNSKNPSNEVNGILLKIIESISTYRKPGTGERIDNYHTDVSVVRIIMNLPLDKITEQHIDFIGVSLESKWSSLVQTEIGKTVLSKLINPKSKRLLLKLVEIILRYRKVEAKYSDRYTPLIEKYWLKEALSKYKPEIAKLCSIEAAEVGIDKIQSITKEDELEFSFVYLPSIEDHEQIMFPDRYECQLVHFVRDMLQYSQPIQAQGIVEDIIKKEHSIFKRIAFYVINYHYKEINNLFWDWHGNPLEEKWCRHEVYELLKANCTKFSSLQINQLLEWIENKEYYIPEEHKDHASELVAYRKKEWLSALLEAKSTDVQSLYEKYHKIDSAEPDHPGWLSWHEMLVGDRSPIQQNELASMANQEIINYLNDFKFDEGWKKPTESGLASCFQQFVSENPERFADDALSFMKVKTIYQISLLRGLRDAWNKEKDFKWDGIIEFMTKIIEPEEFWAKEYGDKEYDYRRAVIGSITDLIESGTIKDSHAFDSEFLPHTEDILLTLAEKLQPEKSEMECSINTVINSTKYNIFSAMLNYSLHYARLYGKDKKVKWPERIKNDFIKRLDKKIEPSLCYSTILGMYLANLNYLDRQWVADKINKLFPKKLKAHWEATFTGYLHYTARLYEDVYSLLRKNGHYEKALTTDFKSNYETEHLVQHICIAYLCGWEKLDNPKSLISKLLDREKNEELFEIVHYLWMQRDSQNEKFTEKIKPLWNRLFEILSRYKENPKYSKTIADLYLWLTLIDDIDDPVLKWVKFSVKHIKASHEALFFVEYLLKHADRFPENVGKIYLEMLNKNVYPDYKEGDIQKLIQILDDQGKPQIASQIRNMYLAKGYEFLRYTPKKECNEV